jgi:hypothetical protein
MKTLWANKRGKSSGMFGLALKSRDLPLRSRHKTNSVIALHPKEVRKLNVKIAGLLGCNDNAN